jgi:hypothetical protein
VLPGKYKVSLAQNIKGQYQELAGPVAFEVKELDNRTLPAEDRKGMMEFKMKLLALDNAIRSVSSTFSEMGEKLDPYRAATKAFRGEKAISLMKEIDELGTRLEQAQFRLNGDPVYRRLDLDPDYAVRSRARHALWAAYGNTSNITGTAMRNYEIAADEFTPIFEEVVDLQKAFEAMDKKLGDLGAPVTPGRLPKWKK